MAEQSRYPKTRTTIVIVLVIVLVVAAVIFAFDYWWRSNRIFPTPRIENRVLLNGTITVSSDPYYIHPYYIQFPVPSYALSYSVHVTGNFSVVEGDTIRVYVMNETCYNNFGFDWNFVPNYDSGWVASGEFDVKLPNPDMYYLVYYKIIEAPQKIVTTFVELEYYF
jgi:hypothetical protein